MKNDFDMPKILGGQESGVKLGGPSTPLNTLCRRSWSRF